MEINELNTQIKIKELELLRDELKLNKIKLDYSLLLSNTISELEKEYIRTKNKDYSTIGKREAIVNGYANMTGSREQIQIYDYQIKKGKIELDFLKREFIIQS